MGESDLCFGLSNLGPRDTDSAMMTFSGVNDIAEAFVRLKAVCDAVTAYYAPSVVMLQAEKVMKPFLLLGKKRYIFMIYMSPSAKGDLAFKGVEMARRDNCLLVPEVMTAVTTSMIKTGGIDEAKAIVARYFNDLMDGKVDISKLVITKAISRNDYKQDPIQLIVAKRMQHRDPTYTWALEDRIPYIFINRPGRLASDSAEDPLWAINNGYRADPIKYINDQLAGPLTRIMMWGVMSKSDKESIEASEDAVRFAETHDADGDETVKAARNARNKVIKKLEDKYKRMLFSPTALSAMGVVKRIPPTSLGIGGFFKTEKIRTATDIEDIEKQMGVHKSKCDACRGYGGEDPTSCAVRDCPTLLNWAMLAQLKKL